MILSELHLGNNGAIDSHVSKMSDRLKRLKKRTGLSNKDLNRLVDDAMKGLKSFIDNPSATYDDSDTLIKVVDNAERKTDKKNLRKLADTLGSHSSEGE